VKSNRSILYNIDKVTIVLFLVMILLGWLNIYAAVYNEESAGLLNMSQRYGKQFIWIIASILLAIVVVNVDSRFYSLFAWIIYGFVILLLLAVVLIGTEVNGAKSWFEIGGFSLQPSEFAKFSTALALASYLSGGRHDLTRPEALIKSAAIILLPAALVALQPDMGSSLVFFALFLVLFREGMSIYIFVSGVLMVVLFFLTLLMNNLILTISLIVLAGVMVWFVTRKVRVAAMGIGVFAIVTGLLYALDILFIKSLGIEIVTLLAVLISGLPYAYYIFLKRAKPLLIIYFFLVGSFLFVNSVDYGFNHILQSHQRERINIMLGFQSDPHGKGYNVNQSIISIGSGGFAGKGYLNGTQTKYKFVPAQSTDFIFCTVGEEWGFLGSFAVIGLYLSLLLRLVIMAERQKALFSRIYGYGVLSIFFIHFFINIGMAIGLVPVIGIPLPFFSYGGSSLWGFTILLFIFLYLV
jgi:rod shape determining protein RodA